MNINDGFYIQQSWNSVAHAMERLGAIAERHDEREANYAVMQATDYMKNGFDGVDSVDKDGKTVHTPGIKDKTWRDWDRDGTDAVRETGRLAREVRQQEFYTKLNGNQRRLFDRAWQFKANEFNRAAANVHGLSVAAKARDQDQETVRWNSQRVEECYGDTSGEYERRRAWATTQNFGILMGTGLKHREMLENPNVSFDEIAKAEGWDDRTKMLYRMKWDSIRAGYDKGRVEALINAGANNQALGSIPPDRCLLAAGQITNELNGNIYGTRPDGTKKGTGWLGNVGSDKLALTEFSVRDAKEDGEDAVKDADGNFIDYPTLVPGLGKEEVEAVRKAASGDKDVYKTDTWKSVREKARAHARQMIAEGKSVWKDSGAGRQYISDAERNGILARIEKAGRDMVRIREYQQDKTAKELDGELDKKQWSFIENPMAEQFDESGYLAQLGQQVSGGAISRAQGLALFSRYQKMRKDRDELVDDMKNPSVFREKSDPMVWVALKQKIADADRNNTTASELENAVAASKTFLSPKEYFALWHDARKRRDAEDDRITSQVFAEFLKIDDSTVRTAIDPAKRTSKAGEDAVDALLGSPNAEYERSWRIHNPDFTIEDVDEAVRLVRDYVKANPGNAEGAKQLLENLVRPHADAARARTFRDRIQAVRRSRQWSVEKAFAE